MAFNPFHGFRRHQKKFFAALTILCMFIFVLSSGMGRGDWFTMFGDWIAGRTSKSTAPASLYGKDLDQGVIATVQRMRLVANRYMDLAVGESQQAIFGNVFQQYQ